MEKEKEVNEELQIQIEEENQETNNDLGDDIYNYEVELQKLYVKLDQLDIKIGSEDYTNEEYEEYLQVKKDIKVLRKKKRTTIIIKKSEEKKGIIDQLSLWILAYGFIILVLSFPLITASLWMDFVNLMFDWFSATIANLTPDDGIVYNLWLGILAFGLPVILEFVSWIVYANFVNGKVNKWTFRIIWIIQTIFSIFTIVLLSKGIVWA